MPGQLVHFELAVADLDRAGRFFGSLLGWSPSAYGEDYLFIESRPSGGLMRPSSGAQTTTVYFEVADIDAAVEQVRSLGGEPAQVIDMPGIGRSAHCHDDQGTPFSLFQGAPTEGS